MRRILALLSKAVFGTNEAKLNHSGLRFSVESYGNCKCVVHALSDQDRFAG